MTTMAGSNVSLGGGGGGGGYVPSTKRRQVASDAGDEQSTRASTSDRDGGRGGFHRADVQEVFLFTLQEPFKSALATLMGLLEQVNNIPQEVRIAIVAGPLGYMSSLSSVRPAPFVPTPTMLKPLIR